MKRKIIKHSHDVGIIDEVSYEGESIENKVARIVNNKEPITDGAPLVYTEKKDGVKPEFNIRTDKWELALEATDIANRAKIAQGNGVQNQSEEVKSDKSNNIEPKSE